MSSTEETYISVGGKSMPVNSLAPTEFLVNVSVGDTYLKESRHYVVKGKHWFVTPDNQILGIGLSTETA